MKAHYLMISKVTTVGISFSLLCCTILAQENPSADQNQQYLAQAASIGVYFGGTASQFDMCVDKGFLPPPKATAESQVNEYLAKPDRGKQELAMEPYFRKGWDMARQQLHEPGFAMTKERCDFIKSQWEKYVTMFSLR
ncbi:hypothetical protein [Rhodoferax sp. GW822-FHT02A01]|uniref:hypothetical protein n=1 Tax=Rhodoferax sp. GW822-FHT02A01 TaxID=3141537 RepID=UPI00315DD471